ncbi:TIR domain-containing protein [Sphingopyxis sp. KK2]|uniref:TIR domain-containing protein n=1 Tax=Sphingopyxis sp. KK2 TaxID=1855727 RepID=UPI0015C3552B|nr:TIR domain-containing protein [Sphingopyxis sp. KK2]
MTDVFISYKREERARCVAIYNALVDLKLSVWFDGRIEPGTDFDREIEREVRGAGAVLVLWSELAADSDWIRAEARTGRQKDRLVAIRLDDCLPPLEFASVQAIDLFDHRDFQAGEGWRQVVGRIGRLVGRPGLGDYVHCEQEADPGRWRGWIAANAGDPLIDRAKERLAVLDRRPGGAETVETAPSVAPPPESASPSPRITDRAPDGDMLRRYGLIGALALLLLLGAIFLFRQTGGEGADTPATEKATATAPAEALPANPETVPMAAGPAAPGKLAFCRPDKPYVFTFTPGRTDLPPLWNLTVSNAWLAWRECRGPVRVEGHVEAGGGTQADSTAMADAIAKELVLKGIDPKAIARAGQGDAKPLAGTAADAKENRRVEVYLMPPG